MFFFALVSMQIYAHKGHFAGIGSVSKEEGYKRDVKLLYKCVIVKGGLVGLRICRYWLATIKIAIC